MKKMKFFAMAFAAIVAVAFSACNNQNQPTNPDDGNDGNDTTTTPTQVEVALEGILVDTYYGESFPVVAETEAYTLILTNEQAGTTYSVSLASYPNDLAAPVEGTYTIVKEIAAAEQATVTKVIGKGESAVEVSAESGELIIAGNASDMEITLNIALADGDNEKLHYKGSAIVAEYKWESADEYEQLNITSMTVNEELSDYNLYYFTPKEGETVAQGQLSAVVTSPQYPNGMLQLILCFMFNGDQQNAASLPTGTIPFANMYNGSMSDANLDFVTASDYYISLLNYYGSSYFFSEIYTIGTEGIISTLYPQEGTLTIEEGSAEGTMKFTIDATSFNGSTFKGTFELPEYVPSSSAPQRLAPKAAKQWGRMVPVKEIPVAFKRAK